MRSKFYDYLGVTLGVYTVFDRQITLSPDDIAANL